MLNRTYYLSAFLLLFLIPTLVSAEDSDRKISGVSFQGNQRIDSEALRAQLSKTSGEFSRDEISSEIKAIYQTGFFDQVTASIDSDSGALVYNVVEKPTVRKVFIQGNEEIDESDLTDILTFGEGRFLDKTKLQALIRSATSFYQSKGYYDVTFDYDITPLTDNQVDVTFSVKEGKRYEITEIRFRGLEHLDEDDLRSAIQTKTYKWWNSWLFGTGRLNREMLDNDRLLVRQYFLDEGYLDATISEPAVELKDGEIEITFDVEEGQQYEVGE
ncbi:MAG: hypothetical protein KDD64_11505, partial [Bdellovibrionales bacterium]|nr:hypothetical protein [Bdellovibrionales bacterium]